METAAETLSRGSPAPLRGPDSRTVYLLTHSYLTPDGSREHYTGLQRYVRELIRLLIDRGRQCLVIQKASINFESQPSPGVRVMGLKPNRGAWADPWFNYRAHRLIPVESPVIYCLVELTYPCLRSRSIAVQHGVWWDGEYPAWKLAIVRALNRRALRQTAAIICVDTNYINWCLDVLGTRPVAYRKCHYIPNFVDPQEFPRRGLKVGNQNGRPLTILFPRRCEQGKGALLLLEACFKLWNQGWRFRVVFCGSGSMKAEIAATARASGFGESVEVMDVAFAEMSGIYERADIVAIPSLEHEGTSLACVEAMYMGKPVLATYIGGLPNLLIPGFNGEVVAPDVEHLAAGLARLLRSPELRCHYAHRGAAVAESLTVQRWRESVWNLIESRLLDGGPTQTEVGAGGA